MSRTYNDRPWQMRQNDPKDIWRHLSYCKQAARASGKRNDCPWCANIADRKQGNKRKVIAEQLDTP